MAIIGTNDTATVRVASLPSGAAFDTAANVTVTPPTGFSATTAQAFIDELTDGTLATNVNADLLHGVQGGNYARTDVAEVFGSNVTIGGGLFVDNNSNTRLRVATDAARVYIQSYDKTNTSIPRGIRFSGFTGIDLTEFVVDYGGGTQPIWHAGNDVKHRSFTVATVPSASSSGAGTMIYVSNESGGAVPAFSDGTNWRRVTDRAIIS